MSKWSALIQLIDEMDYLFYQTVIWSRTGKKTLYIKTKRGNIYCFEDFGWYIFVNKCHEGTHDQIKYEQCKNPGRLIKRYYDLFLMEHLL